MGTVTAMSDEALADLIADLDPARPDGRDGGIADGEADLSRASWTFPVPLTSCAGVRAPTRSIPRPRCLAFRRVGWS